MADDEALHLSPESLEKYFRVGAVSVFQLSKEVDARLEIDPLSDQLRLFVPAGGGVPDVTDYARIKVDRVDGPGATSRYRLVFDAHQMHFAAYQLVESVVAYLRNGSTFKHAVIESIADMKDLLANRARLSDEEITGLWGELLVFEHIIDRVGEEEAIQSWLGPVASEHDFSFEGSEVEVKTTLAESRRHYIHSDMQLEASPDRPLFVVSIQATLAGAAELGRTLPQIVKEVRSRLAVSCARFDAAIHGLGYRDDDADLYQMEFQLRSEPRAYLIDDDFPAITRQRLGSAVSKSEHLSDIHYRIDFQGLAHTAAPVPIDDFCEGAN